MKPEDLPEDSMGIIMQPQPDGDFGVTVIHNLSDQWSEEEAEPFMDILNGLNMVLSNGFEMLAMYGAMGRMLNDVMDQADEGPEIVFEADEELLEAISDAKVVPFNGKKWTH